MRNSLVACVLGLAVVSAGKACAQSAAETAFPDRPIRVVVGFAAGSASDIVPRIILEKAAVLLGGSFVIENQPGAGGNSAAATIAKSDPDGYRIGATASGPLTVAKWMFKNPGYDPETDFEPITPTAFLPNTVTVSAKTPFKTLLELAAYAKANPDKLTYSSVGPGSGQHLGGVIFEQLTGAKMRHLPYRVTGQLVTDLITGEVPLSFQNIPNIIGQVQSGELRALAIASRQRHPALPDTPTTAEAGMPEFISNAWFALVAPKGTPKVIVDKLNKAVVQAMRDPEVSRRLIEIGAEPTPMTPAEFRAYIEGELKTWRVVLEKAGIQPQ